MSQFWDADVTAPSLVQAFPQLLQYLVHALKLCHQFHSRELYQRYTRPCKLCTQLHTTNSVLLVSDL